MRYALLALLLAAPALGQELVCDPEAQHPLTKNVILLVDVSGSMTGDGIARAPWRRSPASPSTSSRSS